MTAAEPWDPRLGSWIDQVEAAWTTSGHSPLSCGEMRARLVEDLVQALRGGAPLAELITVEPVGFAAAVADASGYQAPTEAATAPVTVPALPEWRRLPDRVRFVVTALVGAFAGTVIAFYLLENAVFSAAATLGVALGDGLGVGGILGTYVAAAVLAACCGGLAVGIQFRNAARRGRLELTAIVALLVSGALVTPLTMAFAWSTGYSTVSEVVLAEMVIVVLGLTAGLSVASSMVWRWAPRVQSPTASIPR